MGNEVRTWVEVVSELKRKKEESLPAHIVL